MTVLMIRPIVQMIRPIIVDSSMIILDSYMIVHDSYMIILRSYLDHVHVILYHAHESRMIAARARVPSTCMIWQVVPSTGTCKSINLDLARAARYQYFTENRPAHADQNSVHQSIF